MSTISIEVKTVGGDWLKTMGAKMVDGKKHHSTTFEYPEDAIAAAKCAHPSVSADCLMIIYAGRAFTVQELEESLESSDDELNEGEWY